MACPHLPRDGGGRARSRHRRTHAGGGGPRRAGPVVRRPDLALRGGGLRYAWHDRAPRDVGQRTRFAGAHEGSTVAHQIMLLRVLLAAMLSAVTVSSAPARTDPRQRCQDAVAGAGRMLLGRSLTILGSCHHAIARGALPAGTACLDRRETRRELGQAAGDPGHRMRSTASDATVVALAPAGDCDGTRTVKDLVA